MEDIVKNMPRSVYHEIHFEMVTEFLKKDKTQSEELQNAIKSNNSNYSNNLNKSKKNQKEGETGNNMHDENVLNQINMRRKTLDNILRALFTPKMEIEALCDIVKMVENYVETQLSTLNSC